MNRLCRAIGKNYRLILLFFFLAVVISFVAYFLNNGDIKTSGGYFVDDTLDSVECIGNNIEYQSVKSVSSSNSSIRINALFGSGGISSISLVLRVSYTDGESAKKALDSLIGDMNYSFHNNRMKQFDLNATFSVDKDVSQMSLYADKSSINDTSIKYFMLSEVPGNIDQLRDQYVSTGLTCESEK